MDKNGIDVMFVERLLAGLRFLIDSPSQVPSALRAMVLAHELLAELDNVESDGRRFLKR